MSKEYYKVKVTTQAPVFIGSGNTIDKKQYIYDDKSKKVLVFDFYKMFNYLQEHNLVDAFECILTNKQSGYSTSLKEFLDRNNIDRDIYINWVSYELDCVIDDSHSLSEIQAFNKDAYGMPYISGSSLKGAIRTALLADYVYENQDVLKDKSSDAMTNSQRVRNRNNVKREINPITSDIEIKAFNELRDKNGRINNAVNDTFRGLIISDSKPLSINTLIICDKYDVNIKGVEKKLNLTRECIRPNTEIEFELSIDNSVFKYTIDDIQNSIINFFKDYKYYYLSYYSQKEANALDDDLIVLGGGAGFLSKTTTDNLFGEEDAFEFRKRIFSVMFRDHHHDRAKEVSPLIRKCTYYNGKRYDFGLCNIEFIKKS